MKLKFNYSRLYKTIIFEWLVIIVFSIFFIQYVYRMEMENVEESISSEIRIQSLQANDAIDDLVAELRSIARRAGEEVFQNPELGIAYFEPYREKYDFRNLNIATLDGILFTREGMLQIQDREYFQEALSKKVTISYVFHSRADADCINTLAIPVVTEKEMVGVLVASMEPDVLLQILKLEAVTPDSELLLIDSEYNIITSTDSNSQSRTFDQYMSECKAEVHSKMKEDMKKNTRGYVKCRINGKSYIQYYSPTDRNDWWMIVNFPQSYVYQEVLYTGGVILLATILLIIAVSVSTYKLYKYYVSMNQKILMKEEEDIICDGYNEMYLRRNLVQKVRRNYEWTLVELEVSNLESLFQLLGINKVYEMLKEYYWNIDTILMEDEVITHVNQGVFKLLLHTADQESVVSKLNQIVRLDTNMKVIAGVYCISDCREPYDRLGLYTLVAKNNVPSFQYYNFYDSSLLEAEIHKIKLEKQIEEGIKAGEFYVLLQPKYDLKEEKICGAEALLRWEHCGKQISPAEFIPISEATGFIREMDLFVLKKVCKFIKKNMLEKNTMVPISVNLSRVHMDHKAVVDELDHIIVESGIDKKWIEFEVTETSMEVSEEAFQFIIKELKSKGYKVALDDFGCGYSSVQTFSDIIFDTVKLDKSFIDKIGTKKGEDFIRLMVQIAKQCNVEMVAEGIEKKEQYEFLKSVGCKVIQGYYFSKPLTISEFQKKVFEGFSMNEAVDK